MNESAWQNECWDSKWVILCFLNIPSIYLEESFGFGKQKKIVKELSMLIKIKDVL